MPDPGLAETQEEMQVAQEEARFCKSGGQVPADRGPRPNTRGSTHTRGVARVTLG
jgi:hypothetical protein